MAKETMKFTPETVALDQKQVMSFLDLIMRQDTNQTPICLCSAPGIGKSQMIQETARRYGCTHESGTYYEVRLSECVDSSDLTGLPVNKNEGSYFSTVYSLSARLPLVKFDADGNEIEDNKKYVLFLDEFNRSADPSIQNAVFQLLTERRIGTHKLAKNCTIFLAMNPENTGYAVNEMCPAMVNRMNIQYLVADTQAWLEYAREKEINPVIIDFISANPKLLSSDGIITLEGQDKRFPTPRAWFNVDKLLQVLNISYASNSQCSLAVKMIAGLVGLQAATAFVSFARTRVEDRPLTGKEVLDKYASSKSMQEKVTLLKDDGTRAYDTVKTTTTLNGLKDEFKSKGTKITKKELVNMCTFLHDITPENAFSFQNFLLNDIDAGFATWFFNQVFADAKLTELWNGLQAKVTEAGVGSQAVI